MKQLPTTEDVMIPYFLHDNEDKDLIKSAMIEFAKFHVEEALKEASEKLQDDFSTLSGYKYAKKSILNSYPLTQIK